MRINPLEIERAQPGSEPLVTEKFFVQKKSMLKTSGRLRVYWHDADVDGNWAGFDSIERVRKVQERLIKGCTYGRGVQLRVIKRTCTVETEVMQ